METQCPYRASLEGMLLTTNLTTIRVIKKYTGGYEREAADKEAKRQIEEKKAKMEAFQAAERGETLPKDWTERTANSPMRLDWVPDQKRTPPGIVIPEKKDTESLVHGARSSYFWERW